MWEAVRQGGLKARSHCCDKVGKFPKETRGCSCRRASEPGGGRGRGDAEGEQAAAQTKLTGRPSPAPLAAFGLPHGAQCGGRVAPGDQPSRSKPWSQPAREGCLGKLSPVVTAQSFGTTD